MDYGQMKAVIERQDLGSWDVEAVMDQIMYIMN